MEGVGPPAAAEDAAGPSLSIAAAATELEEDDAVLANSEFLTRQELLTRRSKRLKRLANCYREHYWELMEELKLKHREYYWRFGKSPVIRDEDGAAEVRQNLGGDNGGVNGGEFVSSSGKLGLGFEECAYHQCQSKAMALSSFCFAHILFDEKQKLYKGCKFVFKYTGAGPLICGKPVLVSAVPSICTNHVPKFEKLMKQYLRKEGAPVALSNRLATKFHLVIAEYVKLAQRRRRASTSVNIDNLAMNGDGS